MPRTTTFELVTDTGQFTPLQLQPRMLLATAFNGMARWLRDHAVSFPALLRDHRASVVILGASIAYRDRVGFFDGDQLTVTSALRLLRGGTRAQLDTRVDGVTGPAADVRIVLCPVEVVDPESLGAAPARFPEAVLARFQPDEIAPGSPDRPMLPLQAAVEAGEPLGTGNAPFVIHRHHCEVADQWAFYEVPGLVGASREALVTSRIRDVPALAAGLARPLARFEMELARPYFWLQPGTVESSAFRGRDGLGFVHQLISDIPGARIYGTIVETFAT